MTTEGPSPLDALNCAVCGKLGVVKVDPMGLCDGCDRWRTRRMGHVEAQNRAHLTTVGTVPARPHGPLPLECPLCTYACESGCCL